MTEFLPRASAPAVDSSGRFTRETYDALRRTIAALNDADASLNERQREILAILNALGADDVESLEALGPLLDGKQDASEVLDAVAAIIGTGIVAYKPGAVIGRSIAPVAGETTVANGSGLAGNPTVGLADLADSGAGSLLAITRDTKGRVSGTKAATITGTAGRVTVANGDAAAGLPTIDLATVADAGGGTLLRIVRDAWGRITGTSAATTSDLAEGSNLYHTAQRVRDTILTGLSTATNAVITATDTVLSALGKLQAQISGLIVQTITDGDTTHAPSGDAVFDALALKTDNASAAITGGTINGASVGATTPSTGEFTVLAATGSTTLGSSTSNVHTINGRLEATKEIKTTGSVAVLTASSINMDFAGGSARILALGPDTATVGSLNIDVFSSNASAGGTRASFNNAGLAVTGAVNASTTIKPGSYTVATVPSAATAGAGATIYVSDEVGGAVPAFSDGTNWRRVTDRAIIS